MKKAEFLSVILADIGLNPFLTVFFSKRGKDSTSSFCDLLPSVICPISSSTGQMSASAGTRTRKTSKMDEKSLFMMKKNSLKSGFHKEERKVNLAIWTERD